eukprot:5568001-Pleurochrysis_carterae.AAC.1
MGVPQQDGGLPATGCALPTQLSRTASQSPLLHDRTEGSSCSSPLYVGGPTRVSQWTAKMSTHHDLAKLAHMHGVGRAYFDQCVFGASLSKTTQLLASAEFLAQLEPRFAEKFCPHPPGTHSSIVGKIEDGEPYRTRAAQSYPAEMNAALADALVSLLPPAA